MTRTNTQQEEPTHQKAAKWIYTGIWQVLVRIFKVPHEPPTLPVGNDGFLKAFKPSRQYLRYIKMWFWLGLTILDLGIIILWLVVLAAEPIAAVVLSPLFLLVLILPNILSYIGIHLRFDTTWYVMNSRSMRIRRGIMDIRETTITYENIQNLKVTQNPVQRLFGISNLIVETAGGSAPKPGEGDQSSNSGIIEGIRNAQELRDLILPRLRNSDSAGLGDEEVGPPQTQAPGWTAQHIAALKEIRTEIEILNQSKENGL